MTPFVPASELDALTKGSHADVTAKLAAALQEQNATFGGKPVHLISVYADNAVVLAESSDTVVRVGFGFDSEGKLHFTSHKPLDVTVVTRRSLRDYVRKESKEAAALFMKGLVERAHDKIAEIAPFVDAASALEDSEIVESFQAKRTNSRPWKTFIEAKKSALMESMLPSDRLPSPMGPKFGKLYDGATATSELPTFKELVNADVASLLKRLNTVQEQAQHALDAIRSAVPHAEAEGGGASIAALETVVADLLGDVTQVREFVQEASQDFAQVDLLAKVFDSVAEELATFEVAGLFAAHMASRLAESTR